MFDKILVANRGEIAVRVMRTLREMGIASVAVYSDADKGALHVQCADQAVHIGDSEPASSYLNIGKLVDAAIETGAQAIHPGYGFLSENPEFADAVTKAGLVFIGPTSDAMARLGDKTNARKMMLQSGVPVIPGMSDPEADPARLAEAADKTGYPVLVKAASGGGGKGMRVVEHPEDLAKAARIAAGEAGAAFGNDAIYIEKYLDRPRHVEFQILADHHGNIVHLFERECSIQRRHQKIIEETPSPGIDADLRKRMGDAAISAARAAGYTNAGTVEFLVDRESNFYFLEVNTRLQVEHPITEMCLGLDLVRLQVQIAAGAPLPFSQGDVCPRGHAIECRIYAEDPVSGFMPSPGKVVAAGTPQGPGVRYDSGIFAGADVPVQYDPIMGKLIVYAHDRDTAIARMVRALEECVVLGVRTSIEFMIDLLKSEPFGHGDTHTGFIEDHMSGWVPDRDSDLWALVGDAVERSAHNAAVGVPKGSVAGDDAFSPWKRLGRWDLGGRGG
ncbi:MAG: acetyl-CoA carboxylase biotin carboxylase subunit [Deltaproteobacteria bacterium]|nr:acetyl-CoA carboxylase biotin carboxylase subunit [Deltaproteobacteria bacterium]